MKRIFYLAMGVAVGGGLMWGGFNYHFIRTKDGFETVKKRNVTLTDAYVDTRAWSIADWSKHPDLVWSLTQNGKTDLINSAGTYETTLKNAWENFQK